MTPKQVALCLQYLEVTNYLGGKMKLFITFILFVCGLQAQAAWTGALDILVGNSRQSDQYGTERRPGFPGNPGYPGGGGHGGPGGPGYPGGGGHGGPGGPGYPGGGVVCTAQDRGWEEHSRGHYSCGECLAVHGRCIETCSSVMNECQAQGVDRYGNALFFLGRAYDQRRAQDEAMRNCYYNANNCFIRGCNQTQQVVSRRDCR